MRKRYSIKWSQDDINEVHRLVKNFNAKISRVLKKNPSMADLLPDRESAARIVANTKHRQDLNNTLNRLQRFTQKGSEKVIAYKGGINMTRFQRREIGIKHGIMARRMAKEKKRLSEMLATDRGEPIGLKRGEMGDQRLHDLTVKPMPDFNEMRPGREFEMFMEALDKQSRYNYSDRRAEIFKQSYLDSIENVLGLDNARDIYEKVKSLSAREVQDTYYREQHATIEFIYYDPMAKSAKCEVLRRVWGLTPYRANGPENMDGDEEQDTGDMPF